MKTIRWGILGTGHIAGKFTADLHLLPDAVIHAVGSRSQERADAFGGAHGIPNRYGSYEALVSDPDVEVVYVGTLNPSHHGDVRLCLEAGKHVLCEKPFTLNAAQAKDLIDEARKRGLFLMEAMWTRFIPAVVELRRLLAAEAIGPVQYVQADFCIYRDFDPGHRLFRYEAAGGVMLDLGVYPISFASLVLGQHEELLTTATLGETGVDEQSAYMMRYANGALAMLASSARASGPLEAVAAGSKGLLRLLEPWWFSKHLSVEMDGKPAKVVAFPYEGHGLRFEASHVMKCLRAGRTESDVMPLDETLRIMQTMDACRAAWGLVYEGEKPPRNPRHP